MSDSTLITARNLTMSFDGTSPILSDINLRIPAGQFLSIVGPSGCGKSTLLRLIAGLREPTGGELTIGKAAPGATKFRSAFVFQDPNLLPWRTVAGNIRLPFELEPDAFDDDVPFDQRVAEAIRLVGLSDADATKRPRQLSGGMRMRVSLARALVTRPDILLLDEPFAALDDILRQQLNEELQRIWWERRCTAVFVTHNVSEAVFLSQRVLVMSNSPGKFVDGIPIEFDSPRKPELRATAEFASLTGQVSDSLRSAFDP